MTRVRMSCGVAGSGVFTEDAAVGWVQEGVELQIRGGGEVQPVRRF